jgi:Glycosyl transferase family 2
MIVRRTYMTMPKHRCETPSRYGSVITKSSSVPVTLAVVFILANFIVIVNTRNYRRIDGSFDHVFGLRGGPFRPEVATDSFVPETLPSLSVSPPLISQEASSEVHRRDASAAVGTPMPVWCQITFSAEYDLELMPHSIQHYLDVGIDPNYMLITLHHTDPEAIEELQSAVDVVHSFGIPQVQTWNGNFTSQKNCDMRQRHRALVGVRDCDWVLKFDADELLRVPSNDVVAFLQVLGQQNFDSVFGIWVDRIADQGRIPNITTEPSLEEQFPLGCRFSETGNAKTTKVVAFRGYLKEKRAGHSLAKNSETCRYPPILMIDHYKWSWPVFRKLQKRIEHYKSIEGHDWWTESVAFLNRIAGNGGRIDVTEPELQCAESFNGPFSSAVASPPMVDSFYMDNATEAACQRPLRCPR